MKTRVALLMLLPAIGFYLLTFAAPLLIVGRLSLHDANYISETWTGFRNYVKAFRDHYFRESFVNAFLFVLMIVPPLVAMSYTTASFLSGFHERIQAALRFILFIPGLASGIVMVLLWRWILQRAGLINLLLSLAHIPAVPWLTEAWAARVSIMLISLASGIGGTVILFAASMHALPLELRDAARIDGASERDYKRYIIRPLMVPTILLVVLLNIVGVMQMWETPYVLFQTGGPEGSTASPVYEIFMTAFLFNKQGLAAAKGVLLMAVIAALLAVKQRVERWAR